MRETEDIMGMPVTIEITEQSAKHRILEAAFDQFRAVDATFSTYKPDSEVSRIDRGELPESEWSSDMKEIMRLAEETKAETEGYFDIRTPAGALDPSGIVKGWAIRRVARALETNGIKNYYVEVGGDIQTAGKDANGREWRIGIRNPQKHDEIVKVLEPQGCGIATSGTYARGQHIWDPNAKRAVESPVMSLTVIGPDVYEADRFATAAFAMGARGIHFIESLGGFEGYQIDQDGIATETSHFKKYVAAN